MLLEDLAVREAAVTSDAVTAHAGALGGRAGVVLAIGTGSVAVGIGADGAYARVDGWGPLLGDDGSGARIGTAGLRAALRAHDGRGPATSLLNAAAGLFGDLERLPARVGRDGNPARTAASFAPRWRAPPTPGTSWPRPSSGTRPPTWPRPSSRRPAASPRTAARCPWPSPVG
ncbi:BadF/BadG/BcrA/BcrD ATPase family protein [Streptomyces sp. BRB040]|uniref:BadF/BadG/BcrA/BcrD ATPase family protein n=1 Tax=Streptomyces sp. BRB040 TaxID=3142634 RepID=UPI0031F71A03